MVKLSPFTRRMLDIQGYENVCDEDFGDIARWMKMAIFGCATLVAIALAIGSIPMLWVMVAIAAVAGISPVHPLDLIYNYGIRYITGTGKLMRRSGLNRAACALATVWLLGAIAAHNAGMMVAFSCSDGRWWESPIWWGQWTSACRHTSSACSSAIRRNGRKCKGRSS